MTRNTECVKCYKSAAIKCYNAGSERYYCTHHFLQMMLEEELTQIVFLPKKGADKDRI